MRINYITREVSENKLNMREFAHSINAYYEHIYIGRYSVHALLDNDGNYEFNLYLNGILKAIISNNYWGIGKLDGEGANLANRLLKVYGNY